MNIKLMIMTLLMCLTLFNCNKDEDLKPTPTPTPTINCTCGLITNDGITDNCYWLEIKNNCTGNYKKFCFSVDVWYNNYVGDDICVLNQTW